MAFSMFIAAVSLQSPVGGIALGGDVCERLAEKYTAGASGDPQRALDCPLISSKCPCMHAKVCKCAFTRTDP